MIKLSTRHDPFEMAATEFLAVVVLACFFAVVGTRLDPPLVQLEEESV